MPSPALHFLGWTQPAVETVCDFLLVGVQSGQPFDLEGTLLVVPTQQAGRHLLDALVQRCSASGMSVLSQRLVTPTQLAADALRQQDLASGAEILTAWSEVLATANEPLLMAAFGASGRAREPAATLAMAERLQQVRRDLAEAACSCADVTAQIDAASAELERWQALAQLEAALLVRLTRDRLRDPCAAQIAWAAHPCLAPEIRRLVVACVPDPSLLLIRALAQLANRITIDILIQAPPSEAATFDSWGRPLPDQWNTRRSHIPDEEKNLLLVADPAAQAGRIVEIMTQAADCKDARPPLPFTISDTAIGVPDRATVPFLIDHLATAGVAAFDPQERLLREHPLCELITRLLDLRRAAPYRTVADLLRHPDVLTALQQDPLALDPTQILTQLDQFQNRHLPLSLTDLLRPFARNPRGTTDLRTDFTLLGQALQRLALWRERLLAEPLPAVLRALLAEIYTCRQLNPELPADRLFAAAAETLDRVLRELEDARLPPSTPEIETAVLTARLRNQGCAPERSNELIDLEGWLELPWNRAPLLLVAGMNEGCVPDGRLADDFLPDSLRRALGLRDDRLRAARDAFLLHVLIAARDNGCGRLCLLCSKSSAEGDPLRPSRLLFRCEDAQLPQRARRLFGKSSASRPGTPATIGFQLRPFALLETDDFKSQISNLKSQTLSVTQFKDYLQCPFRFYLRHRLKMTPLADDQLAPDERAFGNLVHAVLQDFANDPKLAHSTDTEKLAAHLADITRARFAANYGARPSLAVQVARESAIQRLSRFAEVQIALAQEWEIISHESRFVLTRNGTEIVARIDRIDRHRHDGRLRVMDYKTFEKIKTPVVTHLGTCREDTPAFAQVELPDARGRPRRKAWLDLQLPLYREALIASGSCDAHAIIELGYFILPRAIGETGFYPWNDYTPALQDSAMTCADGVLTAISAETFWPPRDVPPAWDDYAVLFTGDPDHCFEPPPPGRAGPPDPPLSDNRSASPQLADANGACNTSVLPSTTEASSRLASPGGGSGGPALPKKAVP